MPLCKKREIHVRKEYHVGIAVAIGKTGLVAPVIRNAGQMNVVGLAHAAADLADRARNKQLLPDQLQGGTFYGHQCRISRVDDGNAPLSISLKWVFSQPVRSRSERL